MPGSGPDRDFRDRQYGRHKPDADAARPCGGSGSLFAGGQIAAAQTESRIEIFDAHLHYNQEPNPFYPLDKVLEIFRRNGVTGILATSRPNKGTHQLMEAKAPGLWVVPFIRPYRTRAGHPDLVQRPSDLRSDQGRI